MNIYVEVNGTRYPAIITGKLKDKDWDDRASKAITLEMAYADAVVLFVNDVDWNIVEEPDENEEGAVEIITHDNSEYSITGDIIDHRNGTITVKMGKPTAEEILAVLAGEV